MQVVSPASTIALATNWSSSAPLQHGATTTRCRDCAIAPTRERSTTAQDHRIVVEDDNERAPDRARGRSVRRNRATDARANRGDPSW